MLGAPPCWTVKPPESFADVKSGFVTTTSHGAIRSPTVGMPNFLSPPFFFGIFTGRTGGGK